MRLQIHRKLNRHTGCVNTVGFNADGDTLISGSDDQMVILWDWDTGAVKLEFHSGHGDNVFQARFMPYTNDRTIVTCAADGEVRLANIQDGGDVPTTLLGEHDGRAHKLAIEPGSPYIFYSCGEDGLVQHFDLRTNTATNLFLCRNSLSKEGSSSHISSGIDNDVKIWTPSATERAQVVHVEELKPRKRRTKLWSFALPEQLIWHVLASRRRHQAASEDLSEDLEDNTELLNLVLHAVDRDVLSDEDEETSDGSRDCRVN